MQVDLGCLNRPWYDYTLEEALAGIAAAGYRTLGLIPQQGRPVFSADSTDEEIEQLRSLFGKRALTPQVAISQPDISLDAAEAASRFQREMERAHLLGLEYFVLCGTADEALYDKWYSAVERCLDTAEVYGITLLLKPHGGISALAGDMLRALRRLSHPSFGLCYDPGNVYYYTGEKPEEDLPKVADRVRAMCIKDEVGGKHGDVAITPGTGLVDFERIFRILAEASFSGPCWVECVGGKTLAEINAEAKNARRFITDLTARI